jgi:fatty acid desaturase
MTSLTPSVTFTKTRPGGDRGSPTSEYSGMLKTVREAGLLRRRPGFYAAVFAGVLAALLAAIAGMLLLGDSWFQLIIAGALGLIFTQFAFLAHEAAHRQIFASNRANEVAARFIGNFLVGMSYSWWMNKHSRHHANPNAVGKDPDIAIGVLAFTEEDAARSDRGIKAWFMHRQGYLFFPILLLEGIDLHLTGFRSVFGHGKVDRRAIEISSLLLRFAIYLTAVFLLFPPGMAFAFLGVQLAVFGVYMGSSFAPNHKGMPIVMEGARIDFLRRQVLTSRNIRGGWYMDVLMGGLNHQVEHHLFPNMPRPHLRQARLIAKDYCYGHGIPYTETSLVESYATVVRYLNTVGIVAGRDPFDCPAAARLR